MLGNAYFYAGGITGNHTLSQKIDLSGLSAADLSTIDTGAAAFKMEGWSGGYTGSGGPQGNTGTFSAKFFNGASAQLGSAFTIGGFVGSDMTFTNLLGTVPTGTRSIEFDMNFINVPPGANDGGLDNLAFVIVPEPASVAVAALGGAGLLLARRLRRD